VLTDPVVFRQVLVGWLAVAAVVAVVLTVIPAPYGRHRRPGWGPALPARLGWLVMELPAVVVPVLLFARSDRLGDPAALTLLALWQLHYLQRTFVFPALMRPSATPVPVVIVAMGLLFNVVNGVLQGSWLFALAPRRATAFLASPAFLAGTTLFLAGMALEVWSDAVLRRLRKPGESGYRIPHGGAFELVSCPNYLGELLEWTGFALASGSPAAVAFAVWTAANLLPRALAHHRWYCRAFPDYPVTRRAIIPFLL
jgi:protein-S-isoprenylcysteine O-methyltransferase Ste14